MAMTPVDLYRRGNTSGPRMNHVRYSDIATFINNGDEWVIGQSGGVSCFDINPPPGKGPIWCLPKGSPYSDELFLRDDRNTHWSWEPAHDMSMGDYRAVLATVGRNFV